MALFAVILQHENPGVARLIEEKYPDPLHYQITSTQWIVSGKGTAQSVSDLIGASELGGIVLSFSGYWGRAETSLWEWMKSRVEESDNG